MNIPKVSKEVGVIFKFQRVHKSSPSSSPILSKYDSMKPWEEILPLSLSEGWQLSLQQKSRRYGILRWISCPKFLHSKIVFFHYHQLYSLITMVVHRFSFGTILISEECIQLHLMHVAPFHRLRYAKGVHSVRFFLSQISFVIFSCNP